MSEYSGNGSAFWNNMVEKRAAKKKSRKNDGVKNESIRGEK
jgi:hypothetical protein